MKSKTLIERVEVYSAPEFGRVEEARLQLQAAADELHLRAANAHAEGMHLEGQSARMGALVEGLDDEDVVRVRDLFVQEGLLEIKDPAKPVVVSSPGGEA